MNTKDISQAKNADLRGSLPALQRAAKLARQIAIETNTGIVVVSEGRLIFVEASTLREELQTSRSVSDAGCTEAK